MKSNTENLDVYKKLQKRCYSSVNNMTRDSDIYWAIKILKAAKYDNDIIKNIEEILSNNGEIMRHVLYILTTDSNSNVISRAIISYIKHYFLDTIENNDLNYGSIKNSYLTYETLKKASLDNLAGNLDLDNLDLFFNLPKLDNDDNGNDGNNYNNDDKYDKSNHNNDSSSAFKILSRKSKSSSFNENLLEYFQMIEIPMSIEKPIIEISENQLVFEKSENQLIIEKPIIKNRIKKFIKTLDCSKISKIKRHYNG